MAEHGKKVSMQNKIYKLKGKVQHYGWGGFDYIPTLLGMDNDEHKPYAEYWLGAHPGAPAELDVNGNTLTLDQLIKKDPSNRLGEKVYREFGELPFLLKVLDVREMLSIQVHPTKEEAVKGFEAEEAAGVSITAFNRNYKDKNHKPEVMIALSEFWLLHGFRQKEELREVLARIKEFNFLLPVFEESGYRGLYEKVMEFSPAQVDEVLLSLVERELIAASSNKNEPGYWVNKIYKGITGFKNIDRGLFSIYFFNILYLKPGQGIFQGAGVPHAYLEGKNVELMANSDNVLRGGLTPKHIDIVELMKHTKFEGITPMILTGNHVEDLEKNYLCPVKDFAISAIEGNEDCDYIHTSNSAEIYLVIQGEAEIQNTAEKFYKGESFIVFSNTSFKLKIVKDTLIYKAFVP